MKDPNLNVKYVRGSQTKKQKQRQKQNNKNSEVNWANATVSLLWINYID